MSSPELSPLALAYSRPPDDIDIFRARRTVSLNAPVYLRLVERAQDGDVVAEEQICLGATPLIRKLAYHVADYPDDSHIQTGRIATAEATQRFGPQNNIKFSTFVATRVLGSLRDELRQEMVQRGRSRWQNKTLRKLKHSPGDPNAELHELIVKGYMPAGIASYDKHKQLTLSPRLVSLEGMQEDWDGEEGKPRRQLEASASNFDIVASRLDVEAVKECLKTLDEKERYIMLHSLGLFGAEQYTLAEIGKKYGVSESRISQLRKVAQQKLVDMLAGNIAA